MEGDTRREVGRNTKLPAFRLTALLRGRRGEHRREQQRALWDVHGEAVRLKGEAERRVLPEQMESSGRDRARDFRRLVRAQQAKRAADRKLAARGKVLPCNAPPS
jgi:hypothetical protein